MEQDDTIDSRVSGSAATPVTERPESADASALASLLRSEVSDTPDRQRERRFACPFCGKYVPKSWLVSADWFGNFVVMFQVREVEGKFKVAREEAYGGTSVRMFVLRTGVWW